MNLPIVPVHQFFGGILGLVGFLLPVIGGIFLIGLSLGEERAEGRFFARRGLVLIALGVVVPALVGDWTLVIYLIIVILYGIVRAL